MKRYAWGLSIMAVVLVAVAIVARPVRAASGDNGGGGFSPAALGATTRGVVYYTAAINGDGSVAACFLCNKTNTVHIATGQYQVAFNQGNVTANNGYSRWVQVDTLTTGSINNVSCTTADRAAVPAAVWVACFNGTTGAATDTSFFLFVAR
jgi:hypothetical protein